MTDPEPTHAPDSAPVQLARIEGKLDLMLFQVTDHAGRIKSLEERDRTRESETQKLASDAVARDLTVEATAKALREAKESEEAATRAEAARSDKFWTPVNGVLGAVAVFASLISAYLIQTR